MTNSNLPTAPEPGLASRLTLTDGLKKEWRSLRLRENPEQSVEIVRHLFKRFDALWTTRWRKEEHNPDAWVEALADYPFGAVSTAEVRIRQSHSTWPPTLAEFLTVVRLWSVPIEDRGPKPPPEKEPSSPVAARAHLKTLRESLGF